MVNWNANAPEILGLEWFPTYGHTSRVWAGAEGRRQRVRSSVAETVASLQFSATVNPLLNASVPTLIDVVVEGNEYVNLPTVKRMVPNSDNLNEGWTTDSGATTNLFQKIGGSTLTWPNQSIVNDGHIKVITPTTGYACGFDASLFNTGGAAQNGRIFWVGASAIMGANTGFRKLGVALRIDGVLYPPAGGGVRDVQGFGAIYEFWWGEINPATQKPWTPADIARFDTDGDTDLFFRSQSVATSAQYPNVTAVSINVAYQNTENRVAVGVWRRPEDIGTSRLLTVTTDTIMTMPSGTSNWSKAANQNYLFFWRQSVSPSEYGAIVADDVRWNGAFQDLGLGGHPPGRVYPFSQSGTAAFSTTSPASDRAIYDQYGRPSQVFSTTGNSQASFAIGMTTTGGATSVDSLPYRLDLTDLVTFNSGSGTTGQRFTPGASQSYIGVRFPIIPPSKNNPTLTARIHRVSDGLQIGTGSLVLTASEIRKIKGTPEGVRYVSGFMSAAASLTSGTQYEVRLIPSSTDSWIAFAPDCTIAPSASFGGTTSGAVIAGSHLTNRDMVINVIRQPNPPQSMTATATSIPVTMPDGTTRSANHVALTWTTPSGGAATPFKRYELERKVSTETDFVRIAHLSSSTNMAFVDHIAPRGASVSYRVRQVSQDGRISNWATSGSITPSASDNCQLILTSNDRPELEAIVNLDPDIDYDFLSMGRDEVISIYGSDYQVVFKEAEDSGVSISCGVEVNFGRSPISLNAGQKVFDKILAITRAKDIPYVAVLDAQGSKILGYVKVTDARQHQPGHQYTAKLTIIPTHSEEIPTEL